MKNMKMYLWTKVLKDYGYGIIVIHAKDITQARQIALENNLQNEILINSASGRGKWKWRKPTKIFSGKGCAYQSGSG